MWKIFSLLKLFRRDFIVMLLALRHRDTPRRVKGLFLLGILYLLSPVDILPDAIPLMGIVDDAVVVPGMVCGLMRLLPYHVQRECEASARTLARRVPLILGAATLFVAAWLAMLLWGIVSLLRWLF